MSVAKIDLGTIALQAALSMPISSHPRREPARVGRFEDAAFLTRYTRCIMHPLIGIPLCLDAAGRIHPGREYSYTDVAYARAVERAGGIPLYLPIQARADSVIDRIDALLLPGGDDFLPEATRPSDYPPEASFAPADPRQIAFDTALLEHALERNLPVLGICYGAQLIALHRGGSLHHHLPIDVPGSCDHRLPESDGRHPIDIASDSRLASLVGSTKIDVNSLHHQAIASPGDGLRAVAHAPDRVIEAIECVEDHFCIGVQWHPEKLHCASSDALFRGFTEAARTH